MPGFTANAGGRPRSVIEELKSKYLNRLPELFENLFRLAAPNNSPMVQIAATKELLDRLIGKPQVTIEAVTTKVDVAALYLRAMQKANAENGDGAFFGWPTSPLVEAEVAAWFDATALEGEKTAARRLNRAALDDVVYAPLGLLLRHRAWRKNVTGIVQGPLPFFWGVSKTA